MAKFIVTHPFRNVPEFSITVPGKKLDARGVEVDCEVKPAGFERGQTFDLDPSSTDLAVIGLDERKRKIADRLLRFNKVIYMDDPANKGRLETLHKELSFEAEQRKADEAKAKIPTVAEMYSLLQKQASDMGELVKELLKLKGGKATA